jgi:DNA-binding XRE family transcriptional regulator
VVVLTQFILLINKNFPPQKFTMTEKDKSRLEKIGKNLLKIREKLGLSQDQLAARCDVDRGKISKIENATANHYVTTLIEIAKGLGIEPKKLLDVNFDLENED